MILKRDQLEILLSVHKNVMVNIISIYMYEQMIINHIDRNYLYQRLY